MEPRAFRAAITAVPPQERDAWLDRYLGLGELPDDEPLPNGCVPYLPCAVEALLAVSDHVSANDVFVDIGAGIGRAAAFVRLATGAQVLGLEIQPQLVRLARRLQLEIIEGDAVANAAALQRGTVFFLYCPFSGERLRSLLEVLPRPCRVCTVDLPLPAYDWLSVEHTEGAVTIYNAAAAPADLPRTPR